MNLQYRETIAKWCEELLAQHEVLGNLSNERMVEDLDTWKEQIDELYGSLSETVESFGEERMKELDGKVDVIHGEWIRLFEELSPNIDSIETKTAASKTKERQEVRATVPIGGHKLPPLPYPYDALEPYIDAKTMQIHHDKHHKSYVEGLNKAEKEMEKARKNNDFNLIKHWEREAAFNGAGHYLHSIFWKIMCPEGGGKPTGDLAKEIDKAFGSFSQFKKHFSEAAEKVEGGGWTILVWARNPHRLEILQAEKHQNLSQWDVIPLLALDVWEHAYYLKHQNNRKMYIEDWWNIVCWPEVAKRLASAKR